MREIKFRAWDKCKRKMIYNIHEWQGEGAFVDFLCAPYEVMQYIGLKDKEGKEIYEGDIVSGQDERLSLGGTAWYNRVSQYDGKVTSRGVVIFKAPSFEIDSKNAHNDSLVKRRGKEVDDRAIRGLHFNYGKLEIIGNIYENQGLIENGN